MIAWVALVAMGQGGVSEVQKEIQAKYNFFDQGFRKKDPSIFKNLMTPDFVGKTPDGKPLHRDDALQMFRGMMASATEAKWPRKVILIGLLGSEVTATVDGHFEGKLPGSDGKLHKTDLVTTVRDTWVRTPAGWEIRRSQMLRAIMKRDGVVVKH